MVTKMNIERNIVKRENRFFRTIINKLQTSSTTNKECFTFAKEVYHQYENTSNGMESCRNCKKFMSTRYAKSRKDFSSQQSQATIPSESTLQVPSGGGSGSGSGIGSYKLKQKFCVNICNNASCCNNHMQKTCDTCSSAERRGRDYKIDLSPGLVEGGDCLHKSNYNLNLNHNYEPELPIRYTFSDNSSSFSSDEWSNNANNMMPTPKSSENSLTPTFSSSLLCCQKDVVSSCTTLGELELRDFCLKVSIISKQLITDHH